MYVITADQRDSRTDRDRAGDLMRALNSNFRAAFVLPPDQTAGDEIQVMIEDAATTLDAILLVHRTDHWSIGLGLGAVRTPLPASTRTAAGSAFIAARDAVTRAKRTDTRFALAAISPEAEPSGLEARTREPHDGVTHDREAADLEASALDAADLESLIGMLLLLRQRRSPEGWQAIDLVQTGLSQADAASRLGISTAAISQRLKTASWRAEQAAGPALVKLLTDLHRRTTETDPAA
ncbi:helix-turn-helix domain-containing protein [Leifsonia kafniensis]|uniref:Helix-turn-helix domain-containing protein n=1 Tax=Leifsonia kafniensis TaxID=475957 RepID=A0ABP7KWU2_9MICO